MGFLWIPALQTWGSLVLAPSGSSRQRVPAPQGPALTLPEVVGAALHESQPELSAAVLPDTHPRPSQLPRDGGR